MTPTEKTPLQQQIDQLKETAKAAEGHPFLPAAARDAIGQAVAVIVALADEVTGLRENLRAELLNAKRDAVLSGTASLPTLPNA